jgi:ribosome biogenesis GTPase
MRKARKEIKRHREPKQVRRRDWSAYNFDDPDASEALDLPHQERIMPRGEQERRRAHLEIALADLKEEDEVNLEETPPVEDKRGRRAIVVEVSTGSCRVEIEGRSLVCKLRGSLSAQETGYTNVVAVGDEVLVAENGTGQGIVEMVLPRRSMLARPDVFYAHLQQVIVANIDQLLIVAAWREPHIWLELIDRYLIAAERFGLQPIICVNKMDLAEDVASCRTTLQPYVDLRYRVIFTSALNGQGVNKLRKALCGHTSVLVGLSGVGKSSLLSAVQPGLELRTGTVSEHGGQGQHVTTQVTLHRLDLDGFVADAPGIREFGLSGLRQGELARFYPEISALSGECHFGNCTHIHEPGCAVQAAVQRRRLSAARYHNYQKIYHSLPA